QIAVQIAGALDSAHRQGLIHRDLKPGNVMLTKDGAKLMDFGLAKLALNGSAPQGMTAITQTTPLTGAGTILGTMQYMAPEQLEGKEADARSDIFAFGAILYEMTTGKRAFEGGSQATLIAAIIEREPTSLSVVIPSTPPLFERLVKKCLAKDPQNRWQSAADLSDELRWISQAGSQVGVPLHISKRRKFKFTVARIVGAVAITVSAVLAYLLLTQPKPVVHTNRFSLSPSSEVPEIRAVNWSRISPDGRMIAFRATDTLGVTMLWIRPLNSLEPYPLRGTESITRQFWSPDSRHIAFFKSNQLYKIPVAGGPAQLICEAFGADGNWGSEGYILFDGQASDTLKYVSASGGTPQYATTIDTAKGERSSAWPWFLSDGIHFLYVLYTKTGSQLRVGSIESDESTLVFDEDQMRLLESRVEFCKQGYLLFIRDKLLLAQRFDEHTFELLGEPIPVAQGIDQSGNASTFGTSDNGVLLYQYTSTSSLAELVWLDRNGVEIEKVGTPDAYRDIAISPDNGKLVFGLFDDQGTNEDLWIRDFKRNLVSRLTFDKPDNVLPKWSPDAKHIVYAETENGNFRTKYKRADGQGVVHRLEGADSVLNGPAHWFADSVLYLVVSANDLDVARYDFADKSVTPVINTQYREVGSSVSSNGRYILYISNESGRNEIYVSELDGDGGRWQVSNSGGYSPCWRSDGGEIFFLSGNDVMSVDVAMSDNKFEIGLPKKLFSQSLNFAGTVSASRYCVSNDGQRFLMNIPVQTQSNDNIIIVQNWLEELQQK
ncbi:MAG: serine/threonine-protein kinase, partial [candidate division Zixibacteria bacterium]|nr:serine/threonine-protein kinase [candidate division Zixibacteria bacterium]